MTIGPGREGDQDLLDAVAYAAERLLSDANPLPVAEVLERLGLAVGTSRACLVAALATADGEATRMESRLQWTAPSVARLQAGPDGWPPYPVRWRDQLSKGVVLAGPAHAFPGSERSVLDPWGARSVLMVPVTAGGAWYGHIALHDTRTERPWLPGEVGALRTIAGILGSAIEHRRTVAGLARRTALLHAAGLSASLLLEAPNWRQALPRALEGLRMASRARSAWAYGPDPDAPGTRAVLLYEVTAPGTRTRGQSTRLLELSRAAVAQLETAGPVHDAMVEGAAPVGELGRLRMAGGWALAPLVLEPGRVGAVGLDSDTPRSWADGELEGLDMVAGALRSAIRRQVGVRVAVVPEVAGLPGTPMPVDIARPAAVPLSPLAPRSSLAEEEPTGR